MLKAVAQIPSGPTRRSARWLGVAGIALGLVLPGFLVMARRWEVGGVTLGPLDGIAAVALFSAPSALAALAMAGRPILFIAAAATSVIALPMWVLAPPMMIAVVHWALACERMQGEMHPAAGLPARQLAAVVASSGLVLVAAGTFFFVQSPMVCTSSVKYADGTTRRATKILSEPQRHTETAPYQPPGRIVRSQGTECSTAALLPERSIPILGLLAAGLTVGFVLSRDERDAT